MLLIFIFYQFVVCEDIQRFIICQVNLFILLEKKRFFSILSASRGKLGCLQRFP